MVQLEPGDRLRPWCELSVESVGPLRSASFQSGRRGQEPLNQANLKVADQVLPEFLHVEMRPHGIDPPETPDDGHVIENGFPAASTAPSALLVVLSSVGESRSVRVEGRRRRTLRARSWEDFGCRGNAGA